MSRKTLFEDLCSEIHISIFEYLNANDLFQSFFNLNQYFNRVLRDYHLSLNWTLIDDHDDIVNLLAAISLEQLKTLKCYDYQLFEFENPNKLSRLSALTIFKYATNIPSENLIDFILRMTQLKYCQIKLSQSHGRIECIIPDFNTNDQRIPSTLEYLNIESKNALRFSYVHFNVFPLLRNIRDLSLSLRCDHIKEREFYKSVDQFIYLSKLNIKLERIEFKYLELLSNWTMNLDCLKMDCSTDRRVHLLLDAQGWFQLLSTWKNMKFFRMCCQFKNTLGHGYIYAIQQTFLSIPFLVERHVHPTYSFSGYNCRRIYINGYYRKG